jgi:hypothetical protein
MGDPRSNVFILPKIGVDGPLHMKSNARALLEIPFGSSKHVAMIDEEDLLRFIQQPPEEDSLTVVLMIRPNVENIHPQKSITICDHADS